jgi:hypothetical protein
MKKLLIGLTLLASMSSFANSSEITETKTESVASFNCSTNDSVENLYNKLESQYDILLEDTLEKFDRELNQEKTLGLLIKISDTQQEIRTCSHMIVRAKLANQ